MSKQNDSCSSTTDRMTPCRKDAVARVAGRPFCARHATESAGIMGQPREPLHTVPTPTDADLKVMALPSWAHDWMMGAAPD